MTDFMVFFSGDQKLSLSDAEIACTNAKLDVERQDDCLVVSYPDAPSFTVYFSDEPQVLEEAIEIGEGSEFADQLARCGARFEVVVDDLDEAVDEMNTMIFLQGALQELTSGYLFLSWSGEIMPPGGVHASSIKAGDGA